MVGQASGQYPDMQLMPMPQLVEDRAFSALGPDTVDCLAIPAVIFVDQFHCL